MPASATATSPTASAPTPNRKASVVPEKKYKCQFCNRAFSRSEHRSRHERSRKYLFRALVYRGVRGVDGPWWGREIPLNTLANFSIVRRHQRATIQMSKVPEYLCTTRSFAPTRSHRACQRWRRPAPQRSQAATWRKGCAETRRVFKATHRIGHGDDGTNRSKQ